MILRFASPLIFGIFLCFLGCNRSKPEVEKGKDYFTEIRPEYARGFTIHEFDEYKKVIVNTPFIGAEKGISYILVPRGIKTSHEFDQETVIEIPIKSIVCTSTSHIPLLDYLNLEEELVGFPSLDYISSKSVRERIDNGEIQDLGSQVNINLEILLSLQPEMVMGYSLTGDLSQLRKIEQAGIPVVLNSEYLESHPLGRAEWIKFMAAFFDESQKADSIFGAIRDRYLSTSNEISRVPERPTVFSGVVYGDTWFVPGGGNYASQIINDAGGNYLWSEDTTNGFLELSFESVYSKARGADYWIGVASYNNLEELSAGDNRYSEFDAFKKGSVFSYNKRIGPTGGNEYLELGYLRPDLILKDLAKILHPALQIEHELYFHQQLK